MNHKRHRTKSKPPSHHKQVMIIVVTSFILIMAFLGLFLWFINRPNWGH